LGENKKKKEEKEKKIEKEINECVREV